MVASDENIVIRAAALIADETSSREDQDRDVKHQDRRHHDHDGEIGGKSQCSDDGAYERQDDDKCGDLGKGLFSKQLTASAGDASPQLAGVIQSGFPIEEHLPLSRGRIRAAIASLRYDD